MARWRWLLFATMARYEVGEDVYLRIPAARLNRCDTPLTMQPADGDGLGGAGPQCGSRRIGRGGRWACASVVSIPRQIFEWLRRK